jgi:hypothetical protein
MKNNEMGCASNILARDILLYVQPLLANVLVRKFPRRQVICKQSIVRLRNNKGSFVFCLR